jgi:hypothetical protein
LDEDPLASIAVGGALYAAADLKVGFEDNQEL